jgi:hypothetical protein
MFTGYNDSYKMLLLTGFIAGTEFINTNEVLKSVFIHIPTCMLVYIW